MLQIGPLKFPNRLALAPMAGISDLPFRRLCSRLGAGMTPSEMVSSNLALWSSRKSLRRLATAAEEPLRIIQIAGFDPAMLADAARSGQDLGAAVIDINMGCPAKKVCRRLAGSSLLRDPSLVRRILERVVERVQIPVTLKIRTGWCPESRNGEEIAAIAQDCGIAALTVHGRTRACKFSGEAEYDTIRSIKRLISIPVIANGDIDSPRKAQAVLDYTGADGIMIGRAARGRPWIFSEINSYLAKEPTTDLPLPAVRDIILRHLESLYAFYGESMGVRVGRKHLTWYAHYQRDAHRFRERVVRVETAREQLSLTRAFFQQDLHEAPTLNGRSRGERSGKNDQQEKNHQEEEQKEGKSSCFSNGCEKQAPERAHG